MEILEIYLFIVLKKSLKELLEESPDPVGIRDGSLGKTPGEITE